MKRRLQAGILAAMALCLLPGTLCRFVQAAEKRITKVTLNITTDFEPGETIEDEDIRIDTDSSQYQIDEWRLLNEEPTWESNVVPVVEILLSQTDEPKFSYIGANNLTVKGTRFTFLSSKRSEEDTILTLKIKLPPLKAEVERTEEIEISRNGMVSWSLNDHVSLYEIRVFRNGNRIGERSTYGTILSVQDLITRPGSYSVKLSGIGKHDGKDRGAWEESESLYFDPDMISAFSRPEEKLTGYWTESNGIWSYVNPGDHVAVGQWQKIDGQWYFFDTWGVMQTGWIDWNKSRYYCGEDGRMLTDTVTPDGYRVGADGAVTGKEN